MTQQKDFKKLVRSRMSKTGESYTSARSKFRPGHAAASAAPEKAPGLCPETAALARALEMLGVRAPHTGRPYTEAGLFGFAGGIGLAYCVFQYKDLTSLYVGGRINPFLQKKEFLLAACERLDIPLDVRQTASAKIAEKQLREAIAAGSPVLATVDQQALSYQAQPADYSGMMNYTVLVAGERGGEALIYDLAPEPMTMPWKELAAARARIKQARNRLLLPGKPGGAAGIDRALREAVKETCHGLFHPRNTMFGLPGLEKWIALVDHPKDKRGWHTIFNADARLFAALKWMGYWLSEGSATGGAHRDLYATFLDEVGAPEVAEMYRKLSRLWLDLVDLALPESIPLLAEARRLMDRKRHLIAHQGVAAAEQIAAIAKQSQALTGRAQAGFKLSAAERSEMFAALRRQLMRLYEGERQAATALQARFA